VAEPQRIATRGSPVGIANERDLSIKAVKGCQYAPRTGVAGDFPLAV
jgi:hypothetical protein